MRGNRQGGKGGHGGDRKMNTPKSDSKKESSIVHVIDMDDHQQPQRNNKHDKSDKGDKAGQQAGEKKFTGRCRLFVGNLTTDTTEDEFKKMFGKYGELSEVYLNTSRGFGFIRLDTRPNAEKAKMELDGTQRKGRMLRVRFATHGAALKVKYLPQHVSNELLEEAFSQFGEVERCVVIVDDRGRPVGEGIIEFARKPGAQQALKRITEGVFLIGTSPRPIIVEPLDQKDEEDGLPEKFIPKNQQFQKEREQGPRFAAPGSFEHTFGNKWKELYEVEKNREGQLKLEMEGEGEKLDMEMQQGIHEHQTMLLRQDLMRRQEELRRLEEIQQQEMQRRQEMHMRRPARDMPGPQQGMQRRPDMGMRRRGDEGGRMMPQEDERRQRGDMNMMGRRRPMQEEPMRGGGMGGRNDELLMQERAIQEMQERDMGGGPHGGGNAPPMQPPPAPPAALGLDRPRQSQGGMGGGQGGGMGNHGSGMGGGQSMENNGGVGTQAQMRQSRFDQPPASMGSGGGGFGGNMGGGMGGNMGGNMGGGMGNRSGGPGGMGGGGGGGGGNMGRGPGMGGGQVERLMDQRTRERPPREEYFESKRPRRY